MRFMKRIEAPSILKVREAEDAAPGPGGASREARERAPRGDPAAPGGQPEGGDAAAGAGAQGQADRRHAQVHGATPKGPNPQHTKAA